jgi:hypothetical protein
MQFPEYIPIVRPIGGDLALMLSYVREWLAPGGAPYGGVNPYPPLAMVLFWPLLGLGQETSFIVLSAMSFGAYLWSAGVFPYVVGARSHLSASASLVFGLGFFSYALHFEIERGQFNLIAVVLSLAGILLATRGGRALLVGYALITIGIQLKMYPAILALALLGNWRKPGRAVWRLLGLYGANAALFFVLGPRMFLEFADSVLRQVGAPGVWLGNHSIASFSSLVENALESRGLAGGGMWAQAILATGLLVVAAALVVMVFVLLRDGSKAIDAHFLLVCAIAGILLPSVSHDYTLVVLFGPMGLVLAEEESAPAGGFEHGRKAVGILRFIALLALCSSLSATLFSFTNKPTWLANNMPFLMIMLGATVTLRILRSIMDGNAGRLAPDSWVGRPPIAAGPH